MTKITERVAKLEEKTDILSVKVLEEVRFSNDYRTEIHKRFADVGNRINLKTEQDNDKFTGIELQINTLNHIYKYQEESLQEFKSFVTEAKKTFESINTFMTTQSAKRSLLRQLLMGVVQLAAFSATIIGIIKYLGD